MRKRGEEEEKRRGRCDHGPRTKDMRKRGGEEDEKRKGR